MSKLYNEVGHLANVKEFVLLVCDKNDIYSLVIDPCYSSGTNSFFIITLELLVI